ncbi:MULTISPECIES: alanine--tRNA ligase [Thermoactinomyces]|jgi:alanyl-tRNA synthetase|uniref:Alanine--tRNA ligase n=1 Tax=Thermoactinomyces daqus TaxID=1329516 RepID=A0A7W1XBA8_9BACL|nr:MULTISPECIES: alanine--tRNA ligase [Thermoactinomyces]MBA4543486.1 alanine--tRNA ligase [Thermoactinomyces daqus]MBH8597246.1 alanine--tRNA ligase [Thermoactinomyces sp. CICC 10523]MBH8602807.1 alanine--tRNA ligase [Thermoactinomyces sp. CICC 10522]MBH8606085.1 alanine--tRNA ligase [Thermoactinomyces sp. CICC 10521]
MKASEIRRKFLDFFAQKGHKIEPSASLVPVDDPTLLWINSGVATLKKYFDGRVKPENPRLVNSQKAIRTNDIENVGYTARHHTFFEMLGNFSVGDYFKEEAITWAWEFLTSPQWMGLNPDRLSVTIHPEDDEAYRLWHEKIGIPEERIIKLEDNFWDIGEGPSGPNTEIFYDRGEEWCDPNDPECYPGGENERFLEIWNLVFSQYNHNPDGSYTPLPQKNIDTGMGLERMASVMQNVPTNYDTDLFRPIIQATCEKAGVRYGADRETDIALKVIADHIRTIVFAVADGVLPSNEGRGYVLRRLLRRAVRYGRKLGMTRPFLYELTGVVADVMRDFYPEPAGKREFIERVIKGEEERFLETLTEGLHILEGVVEKARSEGRTAITGTEAFKLYDTYGFPLDLTEDFAREHGLSVDREGFEKEMERQRERARSARQDVNSMKVQGGPLDELKVESEFVGYGVWETGTEIVAIIRENELVDQLSQGQTGLLLLAKTPFYAESGGQVADRGTIVTGHGRLRVTDVQKGPRGEHVHTVVVEEGSVSVGESAQAQIDGSLRQDIVKNHTATHLLHKALKEVLGTHVNQAGSLVAPDRLRFDFTHVGAMTAEEIQDVERRVNEQIWANTIVETMIKPLDEAKAMGAMALFGEKYGEVVRVVKVGDYSLELCGGTHVHSTGEIGQFKIVSESGIGSGTRRIEAVTGRHAYAYVEAKLNLLQEAAECLKANPQDLVARIEQLQERMKEMARENESLKAKVNRAAASQLESQVQEVAGIPVLAAQVEAGDMEGLRSMVDDLRRQLAEGVIVLGSASGGKVQIVASISPKFVKEGLHAGKLVKEVATLCGGGGGGRPDMAQAGGKQPERLPDALKRVYEWIKEQK